MADGEGKGSCGGQVSQRVGGAKSRCREEKVSRRAGVTRCCESKVK